MVGAALAAAPATSAAAPTASNGARVQSWATGFDYNGKTRIGPVGLAFDDAQQLYVTAQHLYRFGPEGGPAAAHQVSSAPIGTLATGVTWGNDGRLYAARHDYGPGDVVELNPADGSVVRVVASGLQCPTALVTDPVTGDLFFSTVNCGHSIERISDPAGASPRVTRFVRRLTVDGLTFGPDGELYAAHDPDGDGRTVSVIEGPGSSRHGKRSALATVDNADGIALGRSISGGPPPFLVVNRTDGTITKVDLQAPDAPQTDLVSGGSRGDLTAVGADGCLYATQTDRVLKVSNADGTCQVDATSAAGKPLEHGLLPTRSAALGRAAKRCAPNRHLAIGLRFRSGRLRSATVYLGSRRVARIRGRALRRPVRVRGLPAKSFTVTIRATTRSGRKLVRRTRYSACGKQVLAKKRGSRRR
jgi:hypothetical protein